MRVGLADDQQLVRAGFSLVLDSQDDIEVAWQASDGAEAVQLAAQDPVDVILMDVQMPGMTGIELARHISARAAEGDSSDPKPMPLMIFVTAFDEFAVDAFEVNALDYLLKPVRAQRLLAALLRARKEGAA